jgi:hypothetical protein
LPNPCQAKCKQTTWRPFGIFSRIAGYLSTTPHLCLYCIKLPGSLSSGKNGGKQKKHEKN